MRGELVRYGEMVRRYTPLSAVQQFVSVSAAWAARSAGEPCGLNVSHVFQGVWDWGRGRLWDGCEDSPLERETMRTHRRRKVLKMLTPAAGGKHIHMIG